MSVLATVVPVSEQKKWLSDVSYAPLGSGTITTETNPEYINRLWKLQARQDYEQILELLTTYIHLCIMYPLDTMKTFWSCNCFTEKDCYVRINIAGQEVFAIREADLGLVPWVLNEIIEPEVDINFLAAKYGFRVRRWGQGRISLYLSSLEEAQLVIDDPELCHAVRRCNYLLMQKGNKFPESHNYALAQIALASLAENALEDYLFAQDQWQPRDTKYVEGQARVRSVNARQRSRKLVQEAKDRYKKRYGILSCEVCGFDFSGFYGSIGENFIEAHHLNPLSETDETMTSIDDIALVCANCHRMLHRQTPPYTIEELRSLIQK